ncbi:MAG: hypothetical protein NC299_18180 [Lachnospiraceae bacterium]|nr:hypothetical protein [Ruminococcus sp.]MCM1277257.1 hypothetical protein [Lachnospiraceae bacterium]
MITRRDECVCCSPEMGCLGRSCPYVDVVVTICDRCKEDAIYNINGEDFCETCAEEYLMELFQECSLKEQAKRLDVDFEELR